MIVSEDFLWSFLVFLCFMVCWFLLMIYLDFFHFIFCIFISGFWYIGTNRFVYNLSCIQKSILSWCSFNFEPILFSSPPHDLGIFFLFIYFLKILFIYSTEIETDSERGNTSRGTGRGRSRLPTEQGVRYGAWSQDPGITTWAKGRCLTDWATQAPKGTTYFCTCFNQTHFLSFY